MLYEFFGSIVRVGVRQFYREILIKGDPRVSSGPVIFAANHPNQAVDSLLLGTILDRELFFLAKSTLFRNPLLGWFFRSINMVPVYRHKDHSDTGKNDEMFRYVADKLHEGKAVVIFPEGTSTMNRQILPLKTGAARIALLAESEANFSLGVKIQPVSITYSDIYTFQSTVTITFGEPISANDYRSKYENDAIGAAREVTEILEERLGAISVNLSDLSHQKLVEKIAKVFSGEGDDQARMKEIARAVEEVAPKMPEKREELERRIDYYFEMSSIFNVDAYHPEFTAAASSGERMKRILSMPIVLFGVVLHYIPYRLVGRMVKTTTKDPHNYASLKIGFGLIVFPAWYLFIFILVASTCPHIIWSFVFLFLMGFAGSFANQHFGSVWLDILSLVWPGERNPVQILTLIRDDLRTELLKLRDEGAAPHR